MKHYRHLLSWLATSMYGTLALFDSKFKRFENKKMDIKDGISVHIMGSKHFLNLQSYLAFSDKRMPRQVVWVFQSIWIKKIMHFYINIFVMAKNAFFCFSISMKVNKYFVKT